MLRKWSSRSKLQFALAAAFGLAAFLLTRASLDRAHALDVGGPVGVVVASRDLARGTTLAAGMLRLADEPSVAVPPGAVTLISDAVGRTLVAPIDAGEPITDSRTGPRAGPIASLVPAGLRAFALATDLPTGAVVAGDHVDVLAVYAAGQPFAQVVGTSLEVLEVRPPDTATPGGAGCTLVLLVDPAGAESLARASTADHISISVLGPDRADAEPSATPSATPPITGAG